MIKIETNFEIEKINFEIGMSRAELLLALETVIFWQYACDAKGKVSLEKVKAKIEARLNGTEQPSFDQ